MRSRALSQGLGGVRRAKGSGSGVGSVVFGVFEAFGGLIERVIKHLLGLTVAVVALAVMVENVRAVLHVERRILAS